MSYLRTAVAVVGIVSSVAAPLAPRACSVQDSKNNSYRTHTINEDDGTHQFGSSGKWAWGHSYSPHGAGSSCSWELRLQKKNWKNSVRVARGNQFDMLFVNTPPAGARIWLKSDTCGRWERVK